MQYKKEIINKLNANKKDYLSNIKNKLIKVKDTSLKKDLNKEINSLYAFEDIKYNAAVKLVEKTFPFNIKQISLKNFKKNIFLFYKVFKIKKEELSIFLKKNDKKSLNRFIDIAKLQYMNAIIDAYINIFDQERRKKLDQLYKKMDYIAKMTKGIKSFSNIFGRFWDLSIHDLYKMDLSFIRNMEELMRKRVFVNKIAKLLGRLATAHKEYEEYLIKELKYIPSNKKTYYSPENTVGITTGNDLFNILKHQFGYRNNPNSLLLFNKLFTEKQLIMLEKKSKVLEEVEVHRTERRLKKESEAGPFVIVVDTSGSMHGEPELIAKTFALALIKIANKEKRKCFIINFSTGIVEFDASDLGSSWSKLYDFLSKTFGGGTDINPAIEAALKKVQVNDYKNADVIFISDLIINSLSATLETGIKKAKAKKIRFHSLTIGNSYHKLNTSFLDNNWIYDGSQESVNKIIKDLQEKNTINKKN